jgi:hypothetical protein
LPPFFKACSSRLQLVPAEVVKHYNVGTCLYGLVGFSLGLTFDLDLEREPPNGSCRMYGFGD